MSIIAHTVGYVDGDNGQVFPITDRRIFDRLSHRESGIISGCEITHVSANTVHITDGWGIASGCVFTIGAEDISVELAPSGELAGWLYARISTTASSAEFVSEVGVEFDPEDLRQDDLTTGDGIFEIPLATYTATTTGLNDFDVIAPAIALGEPISSTGIVGGDIWTQRAYTAGEFCIHDNKVWESVADTTTEPSEIDPHWKVVSLKTMSKIETYQGDNVTYVKRNGLVLCRFAGCAATQDTLITQIPDGFKPFDNSTFGLCQYRIGSHFYMCIVQPLMDGTIRGWYQSEISESAVQQGGLIYGTAMWYAN